MNDAEQTVPAPESTVDAWTRWLPGPVRRLTDRFLPRGALVLTVLTLAYYVMRQIQNRVLATQFGLGTELDVYRIASFIPEFALDLLVAAGLTAPFVPIFTAQRRTDERDANDFGRTVLTMAVLVMLATTGVLILLAPAIASFAAGSLDSAGRALYVDLFRINCLTLVLFAASITLGEILVANRRFFFYALAPAIYPIGATIGTLLFADQLGIYAAAWGTVAGAAAHLATRAVGSLRTSFRIRPAFRIHTRPFREFIRLMVPRMASYPIDPVTMIYFGALALTFGPGSAAAVGLADDYRVIPVILFGQQFSIAVFPLLSAAFAEGNVRGFRTILVRNIAAIAALTTISAILVAVLAPLLINFLLRGGAFDAEDVELTAALLAAFAVSIPFDGVVYPLSRGIFATHNTLLQVAAAFVAFGVVIAVSQALASPLGVFSIPVAYAAGSATKAALLGAFLVWRLRAIERVSASR